MTMNQDQIKANLLSVTFWVRLLFMAVYAVALWVVWIILTVVCLLQTLIVLVSGEVNDNLQRLGIVTAAYMSQIVRFMIFATEEKPFPFNPFPNGDEAAVAGTVVPTPPAPPAPATGGDSVVEAATVVDDDELSQDSYYDPERDSGATR